MFLKLAGCVRLPSVNSAAIDAPTEPRLFSGRLLIAVIGLACLPIGIIWDVSHHSTIGRDTFWTPAHIIIQLGGILPATMFTLIALKTTFRGTPEERNASVRFWGFQAPIGVWVTIWGCLAMLTSAPFDDWWHNTYGLDVKIISPPHAILGVGMFAVSLGILLYVFSTQNQAAVAVQTHRGFACAIAVGIMITLWGDFVTEYTWPNLQHAGHFYRVICTPFPLLLALAARAARIRGAATIAALTYLGIYVFMILVLPLFPAHPKLAPIYTPVDHMVPPAFPLLLFVPAIVFDLIEARAGKKADAPWWRDWLLALVLGALFFGIMLAVQWNFSKFLLSDAADNRLFARNGHWPYFANPGQWKNVFFTGRENFDTLPLTPLYFLSIAIVAFISTRLGLWAGNYLLRLKR